MTTWALQQAIYSALTGDTLLMAKVTGVFDQTPQGQSGPYVVIGDGESREWDTDNSTGIDADVMIHVWDDGHRGRKTVKVIQGDIRRILHRSELTVAGAHVVLCVWQFSDTFLDPAGLTWHGVQRFNVLLEEL